MGSKYIVYVDESGGTVLQAPYPVFVLGMCLFEMGVYVDEVVPSFQKFKFEVFSHDLVVFHEREIRRAVGDFSFLNKASARAQFLDRLTQLIQEADFRIFAPIISEANSGKDIYIEALRVGLASIRVHIRSLGIVESDLSMIFESRGRRPDNEVRSHLKNMGFIGVVNFGRKFSMSTGLQIADLIARPIGQNHLFPLQQNRSFEAIKSKVVN